VKEARSAISRLKRDLLTRGEGTDLFGGEREEGLAALLGNLDQSVFGGPAYPTVEAKAAHLLYFVIKNHPFADGNKRIGYIPVRRVSASQRAADSQRRGRDQRRGAGRAGVAGRRIGAEGQGRDDPAGDEHAGAACALNAFSVEQSIRKPAIGRPSCSER
jgi:hypothetical protein